MRALSFNQTILLPLGVFALLGTTPLAAQQATASLPDAPGKDVVQRVCGACHPATVVLGKGRTRDEWSQTVASMISRGAKGSPDDFSTITDYLSKNLGPNSAASTTKKTRQGGLAAGPTDRQPVDEAAAQRGSTLYAAQCQSCHGALARGGPKGPDLVRSEVVLHDMYADKVGPYLKTKHPAVPGLQTLSKDQIDDLSNYLHQQVEDTLRSGPYTKVINVLTGNAEAGRKYFDGQGGCSSCHSLTGDLAHVADRYNAPTLQQRMLFPRVAAPGRGRMKSEQATTVTVTSPAGTVKGTLLYLDDFNVALRDAHGQYHSWKRTPELQVKVNDPYAAHEELLQHITDQNIHDLLAYLETAK